MPKYNVFFYSKYRIGLKFPNFELQMLCVMNCEKIINKCISNQQCNRHLYFSGQHYSFQGFFPYFSMNIVILMTFQRLKNFYIKFRDFPYFSRICTNSDIGLSLIIASETEDRLQRGALQQLLIGKKAENGIS